MSNKSLIDRVIDLEAGSAKAKKSKISDPNLNLFVDDEWRYKAFRWFCLKNVILKGIALFVSAIPAGQALVEVIRNAYLG